MKKYQLLTVLLVLGVLLGGVIGPALAKRSEQQPPPDISIQGTVSNKFSFQGVLTQSGNPVTGTRDMNFRLFTDATCTTQIGGGIYLFDVPVTDGVFSVELDFSASYFNGQALWLETRLNTTSISCLEILPAPYAFSLRPGANITGTVDELLVLDNTSTGTGDVDTLIVRNASGGGEAVEVAAANNAVAAFATNGYGVIGQTSSAAAAGVLAVGLDAGPDLVLGSNGSNDDGVLSSDPAFASSDLFFFTNDGFVIRLDYDGSGESSDLDVRDKDNNQIFNINNSGTVTYGGAGIAAFPRPAYDSGWRAIGLNSTITLAHNLGGDVDNYVVDMACKGASAGINNWGLGGDANYDEYYGAWYYDLTTTQVTIKRWNQDTDCSQVRIRIWMYP